jgi:F420-dependent oxidoreductase-like protein
MKLGLQLGYWGTGPPPDPIEAVLEAERLGFDSVWTAEAYGSDCFTPLAWLGARTTRIKLGTAIMQIGARTPANVAMTAMTLDHLSGGRMILGMGVSGPQIIEGWYGTPFSKPLLRTREHVEIVRKILRREEPASYDGEHYRLPLDGGMHMGKALKSTVHPLRSDLPIYLGAEGPGNVALACEIADGWLPVWFSPYRWKELYADVLAEARPGFEIACGVGIIVTDDVEAALDAGRGGLAFYVGGMGHPKMNFHHRLMHRMGFGEQADRIQKLFLEGDRQGAVEAVPRELVDEMGLIGPIGRIRERLEVWKESPVTTLIVGSRSPEPLRLAAEVVLG